MFHMFSDSSAEGQPAKARQNKECRTWWPHCVMWMAAMWAIDRCDWRRATGRKNTTRGGWSVERLTGGDGDGLRSLGFGVGLGFQIDIIEAVTNRRLKDSTIPNAAFILQGRLGIPRRTIPWYPMPFAAKVNEVFLFPPPHPTPKWSINVNLVRHVFFGETRLSKWSLAAGS